jgi:hypothetical protein
MVKLESQGRRSPLNAWKEMGENKTGMVSVCPQSNKKSALCWLNVGGDVGGVGVERSLIPSTKMVSAWTPRGSPHPNDVSLYFLYHRPIMDSLHHGAPIHTIAFNFKTIYITTSCVIT